MAEIDAREVAYNVRTMDEVVASSYASRRFSLILLTAFAALALLLAYVGIYGVISRIRRLQFALSLVSRDPAFRWAEIAGHCGYADQSHLIHDFEAFVGLTPTEFLQRRDHLAQQGVRVKPNHLPLIE